jgi:hypothetical protein
MKLLSTVFIELARICAILGLAAAAAWSFRVAASDHFASTMTISGLERAIAWNPELSFNYVSLSALVSDSDPKRAKDLLQHAVALNPLDSRSWIDLALRHEMDGDLATAERELLRAAEIDHQYEPRWSLANFYFRRGDTASFWPWAQKASAMLYSDPRPLFRLCDEVADDVNLLDRLSLRNPDVRASYLGYLLTRSRVEMIPTVAQRILTDAREADVPILLASCDRLLELHQTGEATRVWNGLAKSRRIPYGPLPAPENASIVNGGFSSTPLSQGFDWRTPDVGGVSAVREDGSGGLRLTFSGRQPESCTPLSQFIPVRENEHYKLEYQYSTSDVADGAGLSWNVEYADVDKAAATTVPIPAGNRTSAQTVPFDTPPGCHLVRVSLKYQRTPGTTRIEGRIVLKQVSLRRVG